MISSPKKTLRLALILVALGGTVAVARDAFDALWQRRPAAGVTVVPDTWLRRWDPVTVFFPDARGVAGPEDRPARFVELDPPQPGAWTWLDNRTLQFRPAEPWPALGTWRVSAGAHTTSLASLMAPPSETRPYDGQTDLAPVESVRLEFADAVPIDALARTLSFELRPLPGVGAGPIQRLGADDFRIKALERTDAKAAAEYEVRLRRPIPYGTRAQMRLGLADAGFGGEEAARTITFATAPPFRVTGVGCGGARLPVAPDGTRYPADQPLECGSGDRRIHVQFSAAPADLDPVTAKALVRVEPPVADLQLRVSGHRLVVEGAFIDETPYRVALVPTPLRDSAGRPLQMQGESVAFLWFAPKARHLAWTRGYGVMERLGPKRAPAAARGHARADLRVYRIDPENRAFWPFPQDPVEVREDRRPPGPGEAPSAWTRPEPVPANTLRAHLTALGSPGVSTLVDLPTERGGASFGLDLAPHFAQIAGPRAPGHYLVGLRALDGDTRAWMRLQVTDLALTSIESEDAVRFVVTSLSTTKPVAGAEIRLEGAAGTDPRTWGTIARGRTDRRGVFTWRAPGVSDDRPAIGRVLVRKGEDVLALDPRRPPDAFRNDYWSPGEGWLQWALSKLEGRGERPTVRAHLFTERPVYRPEQAVHLKGWLRTAYRGALTPVTGAGHVQVVGPGGAKWRLPVTLSPEGTFYVEFEDAERPTGVYTARFEDAAGKSHGSVTFQTHAYRLPTFKVGLHAPDPVPLDRPFEVSAIADYYAGGRVAERPVRWRVTQYPYTWRPKALPGFVYSVDGQYTRRRSFESTPARAQVGLTDPDGKARLPLDPGIEPTAQPRTYVVEATITGADDQTVTAVKRVHAVPALALGLKAPRYLEKAEAIPVEIIAVDPKGAPVAGKTLKVHLKHRQWHAHLQATDFSQGEARYVTDIVDVDLQTIEVVTTAEPVRLDLPIARAGVYLIEVEGQDRLGRAQVVSVDLYAGGVEAVQWAKPQAGTFQATPDKKAYLPGETATLVLRSPFQTAEALVVVEAAGGNRYQRAQVRGGKATVKVKIARGDTPRLAVHTLLLRGRGDAPAPAGDTTVDLGRPDTVATTTQLVIEPVAHTVSVKLTHPERALPGEQVPMIVQLADHRGKPMAGEVTLWLVDQAVLDLGEEQRLDPRPDFIVARDSAVTLRDTRTLALGRVPYAQMPGGGDGEDEDDPLGKATIRRDFRPVPFYEAALKVGPDGEAKLTIPLPDNLTRFAVRAKAISGDRFGHAAGHLDVRLPVLAQPALPRFVRPGDTFAAGVIGRVVEGPVGAGAAQLRVLGGVVQGDARAALEFGATKTARADFMVRVATPAAGAPPRMTVTAGVSRAADGAADAAEIVLPVRPDRRPVVERGLYTLASGAPITLPGPAAPPRAGTLERRVVFTDQPGVLRVAGALESLGRRPDGSTGQRIARARAFLAGRSLSATLGVPLTDAVVERAIQGTLDWLGQSVDGDGRVAPFPGTRGQVALTAAAVLFLQEAAAGDFTVPPRLHQRLLGTLNRALRSDYDGFVDGAAWLERTFALEALAAAGKLDSGYLDEMVRNAHSLGPEAAARVLLAGRRGGRAEAVQPLAATLSSAVRTELEDGQTVYAGLTGWGRARDPLIRADEAAAVGLIARALGGAAPDDPQVPLLRNTLVRMGDGGGWGNAVADAEALFALEALVTQGAGASATVSLEGAAPLSLKPGDAVATASLEGAGPVVATAQVDDGVVLGAQWIRSVPAAGGETEAAAAHGFVVRRQWRRVAAGPGERVELDAPGQLLSAKLGDVVEEQVQVVNPTDRVYVAIELPLAAGFEPLDPRLATAPPEAKPATAATRMPDYVRLLDDRAVWYYLRLPKGTYTLALRTRATTAGRFVQPAAVAETLFDGSITGNSPGATVEIGR